MRLLIWHVDAFVAEPTERGRSSVADAEPQKVHVDNAVVVFAAAEEKDEADAQEVATSATAAIEKRRSSLAFKQSSCTHLRIFSWRSLQRLLLPSKYSPKHRQSWKLTDIA